VGLDLAIQRGEQRCRIPKVPVEIDLREQQGQVLEVLPDNRLFAAHYPALVEAQGVPHDVLVVFEKKFCRELREIEQLRCQRMVKPVNVVLIKPLERLGTQRLCQVLEALDIEKREHPLVEHQLERKRNLRTVP